LLDIALDLIEHANGDVLPVLDGAALRNALTERQGLPIKIFMLNASYCLNNYKLAG
jgi:L,D-transpeptidase ErfK/SrfK